MKDIGLRDYLACCLIWTANHILAIMIAILIVPFGWAAVMPPHFSSYETFLKLHLYGTVPLGLASFFVLAMFGVVTNSLYQIGDSEFYSGNPPLQIYIFSGLLLFIFGLIVGLLVEGILFGRWRWWVRALIVAPLIVNCLAGAIIPIFAWIGTDVYEDQRLRSGGIGNCEYSYSLSSIESLRIVEDELYTQFFVLKVNLQDDSAFQLLHTRHNFNCPKIDSIDSDFFWLWTRDSVIVTVNGGNHWQSWNIQADLDHESAEHLYITDIQFDDTQRGVIIAENYLVSQSDVQIILSTQDGGRTWKIVEISSPNTNPMSE